MKTLLVLDDGLALAVALTRLGQRAAEEVRFRG